MVASGGLALDLWDDQVFLMPPLDVEEVRTALSRLRTWPLLTGFRGLLEIDLSPVRVSPDRVSCVDAKIRITTA